MWHPIITCIYFYLLFCECLICDVILFKYSFLFTQMHKCHFRRYSLTALLFIRRLSRRQHVTSWTKTTLPLFYPFSLENVFICLSLITGTVLEPSPASLGWRQGTSLDKLPVCLGTRWSLGGFGNLLKGTWVADTSRTTSTPPIFSPTWGSNLLKPPSPGQSPTQHNAPLFYWYRVLIIHNSKPWWAKCYSCDRTPHNREIWPSLICGNSNLTGGNNIRMIISSADTMACKYSLKTLSTSYSKDLNASSRPALLISVEAPGSYWPLSALSFILLCWSNFAGDRLALRALPLRN